MWAEGFIVESQLSNMIEELFQQAHEKIIVLNRSRKIVFMNSQATEELQLSNNSTNELHITPECESEWSQFIDDLELNKMASCFITIINDWNFKQTIKLSGFLMSENQLILGRIDINSFQTLAMPHQHNTISFQRLMDGMDQGVVLTSPSGKIIAANTKALKFINRKFWQIENRSYDCLFEDCIFESGVIVHYYKKIAQNEMANIIVQSKDMLGNPIHLNFVSKIDERLGLLITTISDNTETMNLMKKMEHQQALAFLGLNVATIAHEIRNPLTSISGFIQLIKSNSEEHEHPYFQIIETELQRLDEMLVDLLSFSKPKALCPNYVDLQQLIEQVIEFMQPKIQCSQTKIIFNYEEDELYQIVGNEKRLKQLLINLIKNAIESMESENVVVIQLRYTAHDMIQLIVSDNGHGIEKSQINSIFDPYYSTKEHGTGLGLLLVQAIVKEHQGTIHVESEEGKGAAFIIDFKISNVNIEHLINNDYSSSLPSNVNLM